MDDNTSERMHMNDLMGVLVDLDFIETWCGYLGLPPALEEDLGSRKAQEVLTVEAFSNTPTPGFTEQLTRGLMATEKPHAPAHGIDHCARCVSYNYELYSTLERLFGFRLPIEMAECIIAATNNHDRGHPGATFVEWASSKHRQAFPRELKKRGIPYTSYTVEWLSAYDYDRELKRHRKSVAYRLLAFYLIVSSTVGANHEIGRLINIPLVQPKGLIGAVMRAVDVLTTDPVYAFKFERDLIVKEKGQTKLTPHLGAMLQSREGFVAHCLSELANADAATRRLAKLLGQDERLRISHELGWWQRTERAAEIVKSIRNPSDAHPFSPGNGTVYESIMRAYYGLNGHEFNKLD